MARGREREECSHSSAVGKILSWDPGILETWSVMLFLLLILSCDIALWGLFFTYETCSSGPITSKFPFSSGVRVGDVRRQEFCKLEIHRYKLIRVITMSVKSICWFMIKAQNAAFTHSDLSCGSRF